MAIRQHIGYCPQHDALLELLTVREHLALFAQIKGVAGGATLAAVVAAKMAQLDLTPFADKTAGSLSVRQDCTLPSGFAASCMRSHARPFCARMSHSIECRVSVARGPQGGNKRKLSVAIATIGSPTVVFLDEVQITAMSYESCDYVQFSRFLPTHGSIADLFSPRLGWTPWPGGSCGGCSPRSRPLAAAESHWC